MVGVFFGVRLTALKEKKGKTPKVENFGKGNKKKKQEEKGEFFFETRKKICERKKKKRARRTKKWKRN